MSCRTFSELILELFVQLNSFNCQTNADRCRGLITLDTGQDLSGGGVRVHPATYGRGGGLGGKV